MLRVHRNNFSVNIVAGNNTTHLNNTHKTHCCIPVANTANRRHQIFTLCWAQ
jgi:hypothetical protein